MGPSPLGGRCRRRRAPCGRLTEAAAGDKKRVSQAGFPELVPARQNGSFMALITLRMLDGADRGRVFADMPTPLTIGREEGNPIQLNDERVSRFHLKIQEDQDQIVLTDLQSTNGTKVNGESVPVWVLRPGDVIAVGRSLLVFGSRQEIAQRLAALQRGGPFRRPHAGSRRVRGGAQCGVARLRAELWRRPGRRGRAAHLGAARTARRPQSRPDRPIGRDTPVHEPSPARLAAIGQAEAQE